MENFGKSLLLNSLYGTAYGAALTLLVMSGTAYAADDEAIEEVIVTGSYLKRTAADSPSPLSVITSAEIEDLGAQDIAEIIQALPWQSGSQTRAATFGGEGADGQNSINLRNLGHGSTLPLINGKRNVASWYNPTGSASVNVNGLVPNIALERIEIVKDGASALYGSDAIAGVVNFITKKDFEGFDVSYEFSTDDETGKGDTNNLQMIWGVQGDRGGIVVAAGSLNRDEINVDDRYERFGGSSASATGQPGRFGRVNAASNPLIWADNGKSPGNQVMTVNADGETVLSTTLPRDPAGMSFGNADLNCEDAAAEERGGPIGLVFGTVVCAYDFGSFFSLQAEESLRKFHVTGHYDLNDEVEIYFEFASNDGEFDRRNSLNPNALSLTIPIEHYGLVEDADRRGIEPVPLSNITRLLGGTRYTSSEKRPIRTLTDINRTDQRMLVGGTWDFQFGQKDWRLDLSYTASEHDSAVSQVQDTLAREMRAAINGFGGPNCDPNGGVAGEGNLAYAASGGDFTAGECYYFNPFGSHAFNEDGGPQTDLTLINPDELYEWLSGRVTYDLQFRERVIDATFAGDLGPIGLAVGFQRRRDSGDAVFDAATNTNNLEFAYGAQDWRANLTTTAYFVEVGIPIGDIIEINAAVRYEDFDEIGESTTDPKLTLLLRPLDSLSIRASGGSSFRIGSMQQLFGTQTTVHNIAGGHGSGSAFRPAISVGNPNLKPEEADTWNIGISWIPGGALEGLQVDADYYNYDYTDIITRENHQTLVSADTAAIQAAIDAGGNSISSAAEAVAAGIGNREQVIRTDSGVFLRVLTEYQNANSADISGYDINASYSFDTGWGLFRVGLQGAWVEEYEVELRDGTVVDAAGFYNLSNPVARPLPKFKINTSLNWSMGSHRAVLLVKHVDGYEYNGGAAVGYWTATVTKALGAAAAKNFADAATEGIEDWTTTDIQYTYSLDELGWLSSSSITVGIKNLTNEEPPWVPDNTSWDPITHDARGRIWFLRLGGSL